MMNERVREGRRLRDAGGVMVRTAKAEMVVRRASGGDGQIAIEGLGVPYERETVLWRGKLYEEREIMARGAFALSIASDRDILSTFNHNPDALLGRRAAGTLEVEDTEDGVTYKVVVNREDPAAMRVVAMASRGDIFGASITFRPVSFKEDIRMVKGREIATYRIEEAELRELGPVIMPAYADTSASATAARSACMREEAAASYRAFLRATALEK